MVKVVFYMNRRDFFDFIAVISQYGRHASAKGLCIMQKPLVWRDENRKPGVQIIHAHGR